MKAMLKKRNTRILFGCFLILTLVFLYGEEYLVDGITYQGGIKG